MSKTWEAFAVAGFIASVVTHALVIAGVTIPSNVLLGIFIAIFPVIIIAILIHPSSKSDLGGTYVYWKDVKNVPRWLHAVVVGSAAYLVVLWIPLGFRKLSVLRAVTHDQQLVVSWCPTVFFAAAFALLWSARNRFAGP